MLRKAHSPVVAASTALTPTDQQALKTTPQGNYTISEKTLPTANFALLFTDCSVCVWMLLNWTDKVEA